MFEYFYHEILRRTIVSFGTLFNNIEIQQTDSSDNTKNIIKVPLAYILLKSSYLELSSLQI